MFRFLITFIAFCLVHGTACRRGIRPSEQLSVQFFDTVSTTTIERVDRGDSSVVTEKTWLMPTDPLMEETGFHYSAGHDYQVYFDPEAVVEFCDSMLGKMESADQFFERQPYESLRAQALARDPGNLITGDEVPTLLPRFAPHIRNRNGDDGARYVIATLVRSDGVDRVIYYRIRTSDGDTLQVAFSLLDKKFREHIRSRLDSVNFAGHYSIVFQRCGAMCLGFHMVDRRTGKILDDFPEFSKGKWGFRFRPNSRLLIANSELIENDTLNRYTTRWGIQPELYEWTGRRFQRIQ